MAEESDAQKIIAYINEIKQVPEEISSEYCAGFKNACNSIKTYAENLKSVLQSKEHLPEKWCIIGSAELYGFLATDSRNKGNLSGETRTIAYTLVSGLWQAFPINTLHGYTLISLEEFLKHDGETLN